MSERKKRKFDNEKKVFNSKWELMYLCIENNNKPMQGRTGIKNVTGI